MTTNVLEGAIAHALEELQALKKNSAVQNQLIKNLIDKIEKSEGEQRQPENVCSGISEEFFQAGMETFANKLKALIAEQPKSVVRHHCSLNKMPANTTGFYLA